MSASDKFLQFPLCALALPGEPSEILNPIIDYGVTEAGLSITRSRKERDLDALYAKYDLSEYEDGILVLAQYVGGEVCQVTLGDPDTCACSYSRLKSHREEWEERHGADALVRIRKDICFEVRDGGGMSFREFRVLCAIYSVIGSHRYRKIGFRMIGARACGCKTESVIESELKAGRALPERYTIKQLRGTVAKLHELGWFARVTPDPHGRATYYSHRMSGDELRDCIFHGKTYSRGFHAEQRQRDAELLRQLREFTIKKTGALQAPGHQTGTSMAP